MFDRLAPHLPRDNVPVLPRTHRYRHRHRGPVLLIAVLPMHYLADELNSQLLAQAERLRPSRLQAARRRAARTARGAPQP
jgi:hypothetical protein